MANGQRDSRAGLLWLFLSLALLVAGIPHLLSRADADVPPERTDPVTPTGEPRSSELLEKPIPAVLDRIDPVLLKELLEGEPGSHHRFIAELTEQVQAEWMPSGLSSPKSRRALVDRLQAAALQSQAGLLAYLQAQEEQGRARSIRPFWVFNGIAATADVATILEVAALPEVRMVRADHWRQWVEPVDDEQHGPLQDTADAEWNVELIGAPAAWSVLGLDGGGVTVAVMDTGVDWQHPALVNQYRGYHPGGLVIHEGNWACTTDEGYEYPVDLHGHGTHVTGTAVGERDASGRSIGVAPGARWIAVKMLNDSGYGYDSWIHQAFEWILAPGGDPALAPEVVNGSWGSRDGAYDAFRLDIQALLAAGIVPVFAAGNDGPYTASIHSPASYPESIAVGATDAADQVANLSSRGPSPWGEIKPELTAPGMAVRSSLPGGTYGVLSGTSMAAPHVSGLAALMLQADPTLSVAGLEGIMASTAVPLDDVLPNNDSGWGRIDAYLAAAVAADAGYVTGRIVRETDEQPIPGAQVTAYDHEGAETATVLGDGSGRYLVALPPGEYAITARAFAFEPETVRQVQVEPALTTVVDFSLDPLPTGQVRGEVRNADTGEPVSSTVRAVGTPVQATSDPVTGLYSLDLPAGLYDLTVERNGFRRLAVGDVQVAENQTTEVDVFLTPALTVLLVDSGPWYSGSQASYFEQALDDIDYVYDLWEIQDLETGVPDLDVLSPYSVTVWSSPLDAPGLIGAGDTISNYLSTGAHLLLTGQDVGYWDDGLSGQYGHEYYRLFLRGRAVTDDAGRGDVVGEPGDLLEGVTLPINGPDSAGNQVAPDGIELFDPHQTALIGRYADDGGAGLRANGCQSYKAFYLAAGLEGLGDRSSRAEVMERAMEWFAAPHALADLELLPARQAKVWLGGNAIAYTLQIVNRGQFADEFSLELSQSEWPTSVWDESFARQILKTATIESCEAETVGILVTVPPEVRWNVSDTVTLTARSISDPRVSTEAVFDSKAPAPILLVDDQRWYDTRDRYEAALDSHQLPYDVWRIDPNWPLGTESVSVQRLLRYPVVIWFTGYDWYLTLSPSDEANLSMYLDGGGHLLLSSQDYLYTSGFTSFASHYLGVAGYAESMTATRVIASVSSPFGDDLFEAELSYPFLNWSDAVWPNPKTQTVLWGQHNQPAAVARLLAPWKTVFTAFPLEALPPEGLAGFLGDAVGWLAPLGDSSMAMEPLVVEPGGQLSCTLVVGNSGLEALESVALYNAVPASTSYIEGSLVGPAQYDPVTERFVWEGPLALQESISVSYRLQVNPTLPPGTVVENVAHLEDGSGIRISRTASGRVGTPDLSTSSMMVSAEGLAPGKTATYTLRLHNSGLRTAHASMTDTIPVSASYLPGSGWASSGDLGSTADLLFWSGALRPGHTVTIGFQVLIGPTLVGPYLLNRAILTDGWGGVHALERSAWLRKHVYLPLILKPQ